jgi:hypothetical protein
MSADDSAEKPRGRPFVSGDARANKQGRPRGSRCKALQALDAIGDENAQQILTVVIAKAKKGDVRSCEIVLDRCWPAREGRPLAFPLPEIVQPSDIVAAIGTLLSGVASGTLTSEEAQNIVCLFDGLRRAHEATALERRVSALEEASERAHER